MKPIKWYYSLPDPYEDGDMIGDKMDLQVLVCIDGGAHISGHFEITGKYSLDVVFVPDVLTKDLITNDIIDHWCFVRDL